MIPRKERLHGRPHLVVPMVMGVEGVWNGSNGPLLYTGKELRRSAEYWNGRPIVVYHPDMQTRGSAGNPKVFNQQHVGFVFHTHFDKTTRALKAEAWLDPERLAIVNPAVLGAVKRGEMLEVSTGLYTDSEDEPGEFNGVPYGAIAYNFRPDHLAILPDQVGACSIKMGAGLCRNARPRDVLMLPSMVG